MRLIEVEVNLSGISLTSFRGQFDTFPMVDNFHFARFVCFLTFIFFAFGDHFKPFGCTIPKGTARRGT